MDDEPMEEEDSFNMPVPCVRPFVRQPVVQLQKKPADSDPDSDDSFETFAHTQSTAGSAKSSASSGTTIEKKALGIVPARLSTSNIQKTVPKPSPFIPFTQQSTQKMGGFQPKPLHPQPQSSQRAVHVAVKNTIESELQPKTPSCSSSATPSSPSSLSRHRSANSGLKHSSTPPFRPGNMMLCTKMTPPFDSRPATPSGEIKMLRDQLEAERNRLQKFQSDFQKDMANSLKYHKQELEDRDQKIKNQQKEIEVLKTANACRKADSPVIVRVPVMQSTTTVPTIPSTSSSEVRKVYPKIPETGGALRRTPRRVTHFAQPVSAFRHSNREEDDDTFLLDASFEPSATSTPKLPGISGFQRSSLRRPLDLRGDPFSESARGAPFAKKARVVFPVERKKRSRKERQEQMRKIWEQLDNETGLPEKEEKMKKKTVDSMEIDEDETERNEWLDKHLLKQLKQLELRKTEKPKKSRSKLLQQSELKTAPDRRCAICRIDDRVVEKTEETPKEKRWEAVERQRVEIETRRAEQQRAQHYRNMLNNVHRKGIDELEGTEDQKKRAEEEYERTVKSIGKRSLKEMREERKEQWRRTIMNELREKGEVDAVLKGRRETGNEECVWTSDEDDRDADFPAPFNQKKWKLCSDCAHHQKIHRRTAKMSREKNNLRMECIKDYSVEQREELRNVSVLTKSKIEAADRELNRHMDELLASSRLLDDEDEDIF